MSLSLAENVIVVRADNRPPMLHKTNYSSWASRMLLYIKGKTNGKLLVDFILNGPFQYGTIVEPRTETTPAIVRSRTYTHLTNEEKLCELVDITATNVFFQGLPQYIYNFVNHNEDAKKIWDRVKLLIQGLELSLQERESKLYDDFDTFTSIPGEIIHSYYMRFVQLINDMHTIGNMKLMQIKFVYQDKVHAIQQPSSTELDPGLVVPSFNPLDDSISNLNKSMAFGRQTPGYVNTGARNNATNQGGNRNGVVAQAMAVKCYNCQEEGYFARQYPEQLAFLADNGDIVIPAQASQEN
ncbi:hypothetical protein Tco_1138519, partial [Tanacetum coccineum]